MRELPLYPQPHTSHLTRTTEAVPDPQCRKCELGGVGRVTCIPSAVVASGSSGSRTIMLVGERPTRMEATTGRAFSTPSYKAIVETVRSFDANATVVADYGVRCDVKDIKDKHVEACSGYMAHSIALHAPERILVFGPAAAQAVLGRRVSAFQARRGYGWHIPKSGPYVPVFFMYDPGLAARNRFYGRAVAQDIEHALKANVYHRYTGSVALIYDGKDALEAERLIDAESPTWISYDVETVGQMHNADFRIECLGLEPDDGDTVYVWTREGMRDKRAREVLKRVLSRYATSEQNGKYDDRAVELDLGISVSRVRFDTRLGRKLLEPDAPADLENIAELIGMGGHKEDAQRELAAVEKELRYQANPPSGLTPTGKQRKVKPPAFDVDEEHLEAIRNGADAEAYSMGYISDETLYVYNARDVRTTKEATFLLERQMRARPHVHNVFYQITIPANYAIRRMESWGVPVDRAALANVSSYFKGEIAKLEKSFKAYGDFNPNSVPQLRDLLFNKLKLKSKFTTDSGDLSTGAEALELLRGKHPLVEDLLAYRKYTKLDGTYAGGLLPHIRDDGRVHPSFLLDGTTTGRLSSRDPNFQNFPRVKGNAEAKMVRDCIRALPGWVLLELDYSQLELRVAAFMSGDPAMIDDFKNGIDIHRNGARECCFIWGFTKAQWDAMTKDQQDPYRSQIKAVIFGRLYGKTDGTLAKEFNTTLKHVEQINNAIWGRYRVLDKFTKRLQRDAAKTGEVHTVWNGDTARTRPLWKIGEQDDGLRQHAMNAAINTPIQGTAADYMTASLWPIVQWIVDEAAPAELLATIHDAGLLHVREDALEETARAVRGIMTSHDLGDVPLVVDMKTGKTWGQMVDYVLA